MSRTTCAIALCTFGLLRSLNAQQATLAIEVDKPSVKVSPILYGLMTEEINYSYDGGLYGELVRNRTFRDSNWDVPAWFVASDGNSTASFEIDKSTGPSSALPLSLKLKVESASATNRAGIKNTGYWGIPVSANSTYRCSFYGKTLAPSGAIKVAIRNDESGREVASATVPSMSADWKEYSVELRSGDMSTSAANHLVISVDRPGTFWFDLVSLFPPTYKNRANGNRVDLMEKMAAMKPAFLRFPGGNYLEGDHIRERYEWKKTIGPLVDRPTHPSPWHYHSSDGMGLLEFLEWCEDLNMQPVLAVYAGYSMMQEHIAPGADLDPYVQDALDEIEYVTGDAATKWGGVRASNGHPSPFSLNFVEIGNEDFFDRSGSYDGRFAQYYDSIKKKYPQLQLIATTPVKSRKPDAVDDHFYKRPEEFYSDAHHYDQADRTGPKIFVGEWATREGTPTPNFESALGDAAWMTGMERNSDLVIMASYAPLFVNVNPGGMQWETDLIGYDTLTSYGSPSYYAQVMFSNHLGQEVVRSNMEGGGSRFFYSVTRDPQKKILFVKLVNASSTPQPVRLKLSGGSGFANSADVISLSAKTPDDTNTISQPTKIAPVESRLNGVTNDFNHTLPPYTIQILEIGLE